MENLNITNQFTTTRKLASIQLVESIQPHLNADKLSLAKILGWQVVTKKEEFKEGEKVVYFEIDSVLPDKQWSEFMRERKFKVKTIKLRGEISQGLILPLNILGDNINEDDYLIGQDMTEEIGVTKFEEYEFEDKSRLANGLKPVTFPISLIEKTDEPRIQSAPEILKNFLGKPYYTTLKYDGTSATYLIDSKDPDDFHVCSRNLRRDYEASDLYYIIAEKLNIKEKLLKYECRYAIQGEIYGPRVSKNYLQVKNLSFVVFNIKNLIENRYLEMQELIDTCKMLELPMVDMIEVGDNFNYSMEDLKNLSKGSYPNSKNPREGLVFRLQKEWNNNYRCSFKIINDEFLIKHDAK